MMDDEDQSKYNWEKAYTDGMKYYSNLEFTYLALGLGIANAIREDETGSIEDSVRKIILESKRQRRTVKNDNIRLGIVCFIV